MATTSSATRRSCPAVYGSRMATMAPMEATVSPSASRSWAWLAMRASWLRRRSVTSTPAAMSATTVPSGPSTGVTDMSNQGVCPSMVTRRRSMR